MLLNLRRGPELCEGASPTSVGNLRRKPDPDFLYKLAGHVAAPVPPGAPVRTGTAALPGTGPYRVRRFATSREIVLERNPFFREWSPRGAAGRASRPDRVLARRK